MTKRNSLERINTVFLRRLAANLNGEYFGSYRDYSGFERDRLLNLLSNKLTVPEVEKILDLYFLCRSSEEAASAVKPPSTKDIRKAVENHFEQRGVYEVKVGQRFCDLVFADHLVAVEIKSSRDKIKRALEQIESYSHWADQVYLAYDSAHHDNIPEELTTNGVGLLEYSDGVLKSRSDAKKHSSQPHTLLNKVTKEHLENFARDEGLKSTGKKEEIIDVILDDVQREQVRQFFIEYVRQRGLRDVSDQIGSLGS